VPSNRTGPSEAGHTRKRSTATTTRRADTAPSDNKHTAKAETRRPQAGNMAVPGPARTKNTASTAADERLHADTSTSKASTGTRTSTGMLRSQRRVRRWLLLRCRARVLLDGDSVGEVLILPAALRKMVMTHRAASRGSAAPPTGDCKNAVIAGGPPKEATAGATVRVNSHGGATQETVGRAECATARWAAGTSTNVKARTRPNAGAHSTTTARGTRPQVTWIPRASRPPHPPPHADG
jgi:hypothetical protein